MVVGEYEYRYDTAARGLVKHIMTHTTPPVPVVWRREPPNAEGETQREECSSRRNQKWARALASIAIDSESRREILTFHFSSPPLLNSPTRFLIPQVLALQCHWFFPFHCQSSIYAQGGVRHAAARPHQDQSREPRDMSATATYLIVDTTLTSC